MVVRLYGKQSRMTGKEYNQNVDTWADSAYRFARRCCNDDERCRDAVQDAFASLWEHRAEVAADKGRQWLMSAVHNRLMSLLRHEQTALKVAESSPPPQQVEPDVGFDLRDAVERALRSLPPIQRECLQLCDVEGYHYKEIGNILSLSDQQVQVYIFRARVALRKKLKEYQI